MPFANRLPPGTRWIPLVTALLLAALGLGWWLGRFQGLRAGVEDPKRAVLVREATRLHLRTDRGEATPAEQQRLLELLVGLGRKGEAIALLEPMADRDPDRWSLRLLLADLRRDQNDRRGAERELRQVLSRHPTQVDTLQLMALLLFEQGRGSEAEARVKEAYARASRPELRPDALGLGLLLADLQRRRGQAAAAEATYKELAAAFPQDQRPLMAQALLRRERGDTKGAMEALSQARGRSADPDRPDPRLDRLAASWGLAPLRERASGSPSPGSPPQPKPATPSDGRSP